MSGSVDVLDFVPKGYEERIQVSKINEIYGNLSMETKDAKVQFLEELRS